MCVVYAVALIVCWAPIFRGPIITCTVCSRWEYRILCCRYRELVVRGPRDCASLLELLCGIEWACSCVLRVLVEWILGSG